MFAAAFKDALNKSPRRVHRRSRAVCCVANPRDSYGYRCGLRLAALSDPPRPLAARLVQSILKFLIFALAGVLACLPNVHAQLEAGKTVRSERPPQIHKISGFLPDLRFTLLAAGGRIVTQKDLAGKVVVMFFGYANCPDICPTTMGQLALVMRRLGADAQHVRIVFVSVDPHRDVPDALQAYVNLFDANAIGLTGSEKQIAQVARRYRVAYQIDKPEDKPGNDLKGSGGQSYEVTHSRGVFIFDQAGRARLLASDASSVDELSRNIRALIHAD